MARTGAVADERCSQRLLAALLPGASPHDHSRVIGQEVGQEEGVERAPSHAALCAG